MRDYGAELYRCIQDDALKHDYDIVKEALTILPDLIIDGIPRAPFNFSKCRDIAFSALLKKPELITYYACGYDIDVIKYAIGIDPDVLYYVHGQNDKDMLLFAISKGLEFASILKVTKSNWDASTIDMDVAFAFVKQTNGEVLADPEFPQHFKKDLEFAKLVFYEIEYEGDFFDDEVRIEATCRHKKSANK